MELSKGQKISLNETSVSVEIERNAGAANIDTAVFLLAGNGKVATQDDFVFSDNPRHNSGSVSRSGNSIEIDLVKIPSHVEKISITETITGATFSAVNGLRLLLKDSSGSEIATFNLPNFTVETAIVLGEIYRHKGTWKFNATGAGYSGGLAALCADFGVEFAAKQAPAPKEILPSKVELRKGQKVNLTKNGETLGEIVINLNWNKPEASGLFSMFFDSGIDLDLACLYELKDGTIGAVQALGNFFGSLNSVPYISLDGDDRTGNVDTGETIRVNGKFLNQIKRILVFTYIYEGAANWEEAKGVVTLKCPGSPELIVRMDEYNSKEPTCAIALLENVGTTFSVEKIVRFYRDSQEMDEAFHWGLRWSEGYKD